MFKGEPMHDDIQAMADEYVAEIKKVCPQGPYLIGGECLGGNLAFEVAQKLKQSGDEVQLVVLLDTRMPSLKFQMVYLLKYVAKVVKKKLLGEKVRLGSRNFVYASKLIQYRVKRYAGNVLLVVNEDWNSRRPLLNWKFGVVPYLSVEIVKGNHSSRLKEHGPLLGSILGKHLRDLP
jgi:hypothetical protein